MSWALTAFAAARAGELWRWFQAHRNRALLAGIAFAVAAGIGPRIVLGPRVAVTPVVQRDLVQSVVASGHVEAPHRVSIGAQVVGTVSRIPVAEGQTVQAGDVLVELDAQEARAAALQADVAVRQAQARVRQVQEVQAPLAEQALRQAEVALRNVRSQLQRSTDLYHQGFIGQAALDDAQKAVDLGESQVRSARAQLDTARPGGSDLAVAASALALAHANADAARARLRYMTIVAPAAGTLISRDVEPGDVVQPGKTLMQLSPSGETQLVVLIDEKNLHLLKTGQAASASADAFSEQRFAAQLVYINPGIDPQRGSVEVKLAVPHPPDYLRQDMTVSVDILIAQRPQAVLVPTDDVHDASSAEPWVLKLDGRHARRQPLRLGMRSGGVSEVLNGLQVGDQVVAASSNTTDGMRIRAAPAASPAKATPR